MHLPANRQSAIGNRKFSGVTLVEVVIAIFVLTIGVLSIISLFPSGYSLSQSAVDRSISALAARDAVARVLAEASKGSITFPKEPGTSTTDEPLYKYYKASGKTYGVPPSHRIGTISSVSEHSLGCLILGDVTPETTSSSPQYWPDLAGYYFVITSGAAAGGVYRIASSTGGTVNFASSGANEVTFRVGDATAGQPVRVGDYFALIGNKSGTKCFPGNFLTPLAPDPDPDVLNRTIAIATQGDPTAPWQYSYGCILSASSPESRHVYRVDVFVFRSFQDAGTVEEQDRAVGHFVTHIHALEDYDHLLEEP